MPTYNTKQRKILLDYLSQNADIQLTATQIASELINHKISISAIYRNLSDLVAEGKVRRLNTGNSRKAFYQYIVAESCKEHLHLHCQECGKTFHLDIENTNLIIGKVSKNKDFFISPTDTVLYGTCKVCQK